MNEHYPVPPAWLAQQPGDVPSAAAAWLATPALSALSRALGGPVVRRIPGDLPALAQWSRRVLDTRHGAERHEARRGDLPEPAIRLLAAAARDLGLLATRAPALRAYDTVVILGGTATGNRLRVALTAEFARQGTGMDVVAGLSAHRLITAGERTAEQVPPAEHTEWQNLLREISTAFHVAASARPGPEAPAAGFLTALDQEFGDPAGRRIRILAAPSRDRNRRANTADAVDYLTRRIPAARRQRVLVVTSAIYAPYQFFTVSPPLLAAGTRHAELVGTPTQAAGGEALLAQRFAQEIHSAIQATARLWPA